MLNLPTHTIRTTLMSDSKQFSASTTPSPKKQWSINPQQSNKQKSQLCRRFMQSGHCPYADRCKFAHGCHQLQRNQQLNMKYKTKECQNYKHNLCCIYGNRCNFIHAQNTQLKKGNIQDIQLNLALRSGRQSSRLLELLQNSIIVNNQGVHLFNDLSSKVHGKIIHWEGQLRYYCFNSGKVYLVVENKTLCLFVVKKISLEGLSFVDVDKTMRQIEIHRHLSHLNIVHFKEYFLEDDVLLILMEYCECKSDIIQDGDLALYLKNMQEKEQLFDQPLVMNWFIQLLEGIVYLHDHKIIHRDIKPQNIFINQEGVLKLADFGISKAMEQTQEKAMTLVGTPYYLSPQACKNQGYTAKSDIWSLGCVLYELCSLKHAFEGSNVLSLANKITHDKVDKIPVQYSKQLFGLIEWLLQKNPDNRPTAKQILQSQYVHKYVSSFVQTVQEKTLKQQNLQQYDNQFMPNVQNDYSNQFLEDQSFHPKNTGTTNQTQSMTLTTFKSPLEQEISPRKSASNKLREKCKKKMGDELFDNIYSLMRKLKNEGQSQIEIEDQVKKQYPNKSTFDQAMDVAQLIYIEDNP